LFVCCIYGDEDGIETTELLLPFMDTKSKSHSVELGSLRTYSRASSCHWSFAILESDPCRTCSLLQVFCNSGILPCCLGLLGSGPVTKAFPGPPWIPLQQESLVLAVLLAKAPRTDDTCLLSPTACGPEYSLLLPLKSCLPLGEENWLAAWQGDLF
jgi:hypothetical protein